MEDDDITWNARLEQASILSEREAECEMCAGTGGWPSVNGLVICKPCNGTGMKIPTSSTTQ